MQHLPDALSPGRSFPLGATWDGLGINFAVFSAHAERIDLCLFEPSGRHEIARYTLPEYTDEVWHGYLPNTTAGLRYGYRAFGPYAPERGHRFNHHKLLLDPYARALAGHLHWSDALYGFRQHSTRGDLSFDRRDSAPSMLKCVVTDDSFNWGDDRPPAVPWSDTVIYEAHVRGLTMLRNDIRPLQRGTFAGLAHPGMIDHLRRLGVTAIELMPVQAFLQDRTLQQRGLRNYWGYNTLGFFAPEPSYLSDGSPNEMRVAVRRLHAAGIEVILDVVYNHTAESDEAGPTLSFRGLDNASYYRLEAGNQRRPVNDTGTGNTLNLSHPKVLQMVMDSLRHLVTSFHVDGFRFDLCATLGRESHGFDPGSGFYDALRQDPVLAGVKLIAEPWDIGPGGYQLGNHPPGFAEWNDRFRDGVRRYWRGDGGHRPAIAARLAGSADIFAHRGRRPWASVNYVASHDGFTLTDAVTFVERHNGPNGESNHDGHPANHTSNWGVEGPSDDPAINAVRDRVKRAMLTTVFLAAGTPMLLAGDEFGRTQRGNNNAYCQDNEISWLDWSMAASPPGIALTAYVARLIELRREHPVLRHPHFLHGKAHPAPGIADIAWFDQSGGTIPVEAWNDIEQRTLILRRSMRVSEGRVEILSLLVNPGDRPCDFRLPEPHLPGRVVLDSAEPETHERPITGQEVRVAAHSAVLLYAEHLG
ncbi:MAG TPA: glycogen debranching protein GlgX [Acetobacteraceae bacterium]|jgi:isoamylase|nr:glycogen debranching protein GlgX [Acetobacteraceae bacterium]